MYATRPSGVVPFCVARVRGGWLPRLGQIDRPRRKRAKEKRTSVVDVLASFNTPSPLRWFWIVSRSPSNLAPCDDGRSRPTPTRA